MVTMTHPETPTGRLAQQRPEWLEESLYPFTSLYI